MKNLILFISFLWGAISANAQTRLTDLSQVSLKGKVKSVITYTFRGENHLIPDTTGSVEKTVETFNEKGWALDEKRYKNDMLTDRFLFEYIGDSIVVNNQFNSSGKLHAKYIYRYDSDGKETEFDMKSDAQPQIRLAKINYRCIYKYNESGDRISDEQYIDDNRLTMKTTSKYNDHHQRIQSDEEWFFDKTVKKSKITYTYDNAGNLLKSEICDLDGKRTGGNEISYNKFDKYGNWLMKTSTYYGHTLMQGDIVFMSISKRIIEYYE